MDAEGKPIDPNSNKCAKNVPFSTNTHHFVGTFTNFQPHVGFRRAGGEAQ